MPNSETKWLTYHVYANKILSFIISESDLESKQNFENVRK